MNLIAFVFGAAVGSFLNVVSTRYDPERFVFGRQLLGRSCCPHCSRTLCWFELVPILSFIFLGGRCRTCGVGIGWRYPLVEVLSGLIFVFVPEFLRSPLFLNSQFYILNSVLWVTVLLVLLLVSIIDLRLRLIPDELSVFLAALGIALLFEGNSAPQGTFIGPYALLFGAQGNVWFNRLVAVGFAAALFGFLIGITRGRGMGMGDLKLSIALALLFGWPNILVVAGSAFILGSLAGGYLLLSGRGTLKSALPFGPFLALASAVVFFGQNILDLYFGLFRG